MKTLTHTVVALLLVASSAHAQQAVQWKTSNGGNGHWYSLRPLDGRTWTQVRAACAADAGYLATMNGPAERDFMVTVMAGNTCALGGVQTVTQLQDEPSIGLGWANGEPMTWTNWASWEPNNTDSYGAPAENVMACFASGIWVDLADHLIWTQHCMIEWSADCNHDGIVDYGQCHDGTLPDFNANNVPDCCEGSTPCVIGSYPVQWREADGGNGHWYQLRRRASVVSWSSAREECLALGGDLASILSEAEDKFVFGVADRPGAWQGYLGPWLGGLQVPGTGEPLGIWRWSSGEPWGYVGPDSSFPNNGGPPGTDENRLHYIDFVRKWNDLPEDGCPENGGGVRALVAEWSADCNNDGIVDYGQILAGQLADLNHDGIPDACQQPTCHDADLYPSGRIDGADLAGLLSEWGPANASTRADIDHDGKVDGADLAFLLSVWGPCQN